MNDTRPVAIIGIGLMGEVFARRLLGFPSLVMT